MSRWRIWRGPQRDGAEDRAWRVGKSPIRVGAFTYGDERMSIREWGEGAGLTIGRYCSIAANVTILLGGNHRTEWITTYPFGHVHIDRLGGEGIVGNPFSRGDVEIGNDVWIGHGATILSGVSIGHGAVVAAQAVVSRDVPPYHIVAGNPARTVTERFAPEIVALLLELSWWDLPEGVVRAIAGELSAPPTVPGLRALIARTRTAAGTSEDA